jgi:hypothetical protein
MSKVTLSNQTLNVLKNYSTINSSILIREGNQLKTISVGENSIAQYTCEETFPQTFGIYDLNQFLSGLTLFNDPVLEFAGDEYVTIRSKGQSAKYYFSNPEITLKSAPDRNVNFPETDIEFDLSMEQISGLHKASSVYSIPDLSFVSTSSGVSLSVCDRENETGNVFSVDVPGTSTGEYELFMKMENVRLLPGDYKVKVSTKLITEWKHKSLDLTYYIALEP